MLNNTKKFVEIAKGLTTTQMVLKLVDLAFPSKSLLQGKKIKRVLERDFFGNKCFVDCAIPVIMTATSLKQQATVYIDEGRIVDGIMCSIGQPGAQPPYKYRGDHFVDGGLLKPVPVDILLQRGRKSHCRMLA